MNKNYIIRALSELFGPEAGLCDVSPVAGGDINKAYRITLSDGKCVFWKENSERNAGFFEAEYKGLAAIKMTNTISVPEVLKTEAGDGRSYLILEYLEAAPKKAGYWEHFGRQLAAMHRADMSELTPGGRYGFPEDNYIGAGKQINTVCGSWIEFFRNCRLEPQFKKALTYFNKSDRKAMQYLLDHLKDYLTEPDFPSLLHGDLWSGNFVTGPDGYAWLIDPAVYVGHAEADIAMTELFGGFSSAFYAAYREEAGEEGLIQPGYSDRRDLYNLYHLLNHLNLFGGGYYGSAMRIIRKYAI